MRAFDKKTVISVTTENIKSLAVGGKERSLIENGNLAASFSAPLTQINNPGLAGLGAERE